MNQEGGQFDYMAPDDKARVEVRAVEILADQGYMLPTAKAVDLAIQDLGGLSRDDGKRRFRFNKDPSVTLGGGQPQGRPQGQPQGQPTPTQADIPPPAQRRVGQVYDTPRGPLMWTGEGWVEETL